MRLEPMTVVRARSMAQQATGRPRTPPRTCKEMAEEFGVPVQQLAAELRNTTVERPKPRLVCRGVRPATWYDPDEMRRWWKAHNEARAAKEPQA